MTLSEVFYWLLNISLIGSATGIIILLLRRIKKLPRFVVYCLWAIPLIRLWLPFGLAADFSLLSLISKFTTKTVVVWQDIPEVSVTMTNSIMGAKSYFPIQYKSELLAQVFGVASIVWIIIAAASILAVIMLYVFTKQELRSIELIEGNIYKSDKILAPSVYGIITPKIIIPASIAKGDISYIIMHEKVHIRRRDNLLRVIAVLTACVHWYNPLIWVFLKCFFEDMELACDAGVLKRLNLVQAKEYASAILACAKGTTFFAAAFGGARTRLRIENILSYSKLTWLSAVCFAALAISIVAILITNASI